MVHASKKKLLFLVNEPDVQNFLFTCIEKAGFQVEYASDGVDALEKIRAEAPDLIALEMVMPRKSGINLMRKLRRNEDWTGIPVIVITAHDHDEFGSEEIKELRTITSGDCRLVIMKQPVEPENLIKTICEIFKVAPNPN